MKSMTGYASAEKSFDGINLSLELKGYNSRFLDIYINAPSELAKLTMKMKERLTAQCERGKVELNIKISGVGNKTIKANLALAQAYYNEIQKVYKAIGKFLAPRADLILRQKGVLENDDCDLDEQSQAQLLELFEQTLQAFKLAQKKEGIALAHDILAMIEKIESSLQAIKTHSDKIEVFFQKQLRAKLAQFTSQVVDENRLLQELALMLVKHTINEEIIRLESHLGALRSEINAKDCAGKKIDFIAQEINREINTIASKNQLIEISQEVIEIKHALENIREQVRNVK